MTSVESLLRPFLSRPARPVAPKAERNQGRGYRLQRWPSSPLTSTFWVNDSAPLFGSILFFEKDRGGTGRHRRQGALRSSDKANIICDVINSEGPD